jgi:hypothetical protein
MHGGGARENPVDEYRLMYAMNRLNRRDLEIVADLTCRV